jgi:hypothetical protein
VVNRSPRPRRLALLCTLLLLVALAAPAAAAPTAGPLRCSASVGPVSCTSSGAVTLFSTAATHFQGASGGGASFDVNGIACDGGWINMPAGFNNNISSTDGMCTVRHHDGPNLGGAWQVTGPGGPFNLSTLDNRTSSAIYY